MAAYFHCLAQKTPEATALAWRQLCLGAIIRGLIIYYLSMSVYWNLVIGGFISFHGLVMVDTQVRSPHNTPWTTMDYKIELPSMSPSWQPYNFLWDLKHDGDYYKSSSAILTPPGSHSDTCQTLSENILPSIVISTLTSTTLILLEPLQPVPPMATSSPQPLPRIRTPQRPYYSTVRAHLRNNANISVPHPCLHHLHHLHHLAL